METEWIIEKDMVDFLNSNLGMKVFLELAPENAKEPFSMLTGITVGAVRSLYFFHPTFQLDVFGKTAAEAISRAETIVLKLNGTDAEYGSTLFDSIRAERVSLIHIEDGSWKAPIEITANCIRRKDNVQ